jgi:hypothetical protein
MLWKAAGVSLISDLSKPPSGRSRVRPPPGRAEAARRPADAGDSCVGWGGAARPAGRADPEGGAQPARCRRGLPGLRAAGWEGLVHHLGADHNRRAPPLSHTAARHASAAFAPPLCARCSCALCAAAP